MNILWIDYWTKYIWLAKKDTKHWLIIPVWYIRNDWSTIFELVNIIYQYNITKIVIWYPQRQKDMQEKIDNFIKEIKLSCSDIKILKIDEDYTSVEANVVTWNFNKKPWEEDTISAMKILERYEILKNNKQ